MWFSNSWNNFAPFAGYMLRGYEYQRAGNAAVTESTKLSQKQTPSERGSSSHH
jgi:hypothetical protein